MVEFFAEHADAEEIKIDANWGIEQIHGRQLLPEAHHGDGFYYCRIQKQLKKRIKKAGSFACFFWLKFKGYGDL